MFCVIADHSVRTSLLSAKSALLANELHTCKIHLASVLRV